MYTIVKSILFLLSAERAHHLTLKLLRFSMIIPGISYLVERFYAIQHKKLRKTLWGIEFPNPVGLAAGLDKNAVVFPELGKLGFGFVEIGTVTPQPQDGNPKPRLFRIVEDEAIINRMGFNNDGVEEVINNIKKGKKRSGGDIILGGNLGKNKVTPNENANEDYLIALEGLYPYVDYFVVNVSSPNTPNLRVLQEKEPLTKLLQELKDAIARKPRNKPILLKIAPDLTNEQLDDIVDIVNTTLIDGVIATNTTISRDGLSISKETIDKIGAGGLSGRPLTQRSTEVIKYLSSRTSKPIVAVGGIMSVEDALEKLNAGASLIQIYSGFIYNGPKLIKEINEAIIDRGANYK